jgi:hypothetical protein
MEMEDIYGEYNDFAAYVADLQKIVDNDLADLTDEQNLALKIFKVMKKNNFDNTKIPIRVQGQYLTHYVRGVEGYIKRKESNKREEVIAKEVAKAKHKVEQDILRERIRRANQHLIPLTVKDELMKQAGIRAREAMELKRFRETEERYRIQAEKEREGYLLFTSKL